ncbi:MAG: tRNA dihydrouridine(20/20a) synthase DusA [Xanthomonadales bacterium]|nr:tRNA dihydrouridine(20/20a) synthase DusA [Xanthomonadales bacterium]
MEPTRQTSGHRLCVAPMMDWTDRHCRWFHRLLAPSARLYTEMVTTGAVLHGDRERLLGFDAFEHPVALQLGGSDPEDLARSAQIAEQWGYDEINLNVGCPSDRVQKGRFGACLMREPVLVRDCMTAMREAVGIPVTLKCRLGLDDLYSYDYFRDFVAHVSESGCRTVIAHARIALLKGLSPKENREVPPLHHDWVYRLKQELPELTVVINGGITDVAGARAQLEQVDGVMLGRAAYQRPLVLSECEQAFCSAREPLAVEEIVSRLGGYLQRLVADGHPVSRMTRHVLGLMQGMPGARSWRRHISEQAHLQPDNWRILEEALAAARDSGAARSMDAAVLLENA